MSRVSSVVTRILIDTKFEMIGLNAVYTKVVEISGWNGIQIIKLLRQDQSELDKVKVGSLIDPLTSQIHHY